MTEKRSAEDIRHSDTRGGQSPLGDKDLKSKYHVIDQERLLSWSPAVSSIENNMVLLIEW